MSYPPTIVDLFIERIVFSSPTHDTLDGQDKLEKARPLYSDRKQVLQILFNNWKQLKGLLLLIRKNGKGYLLKSPSAWPSNILILSEYWWYGHKRVLWSSSCDQLPAIRHPQYLTRADQSNDAHQHSHNREKWAKMTLKFCHDIDMYYCLAILAGDGHNISAQGESLALVNRNSWLSTSKFTLSHFRNSFF